MPENIYWSNVGNDYPVLFNDNSEYPHIENFIEDVFDRTWWSKLTSFRTLLFSSGDAEHALGIHFDILRFPKQCGITIVSNVCVKEVIETEEDCLDFDYISSKEFPSVFFDPDSPHPIDFDYLTEKYESSLKELFEALNNSIQFLNKSIMLTYYIDEDSHKSHSDYFSQWISMFTELNKQGFYPVHNGSSSIIQVDMFSSKLK